MNTRTTAENEHPWVLLRNVSRHAVPSKQRLRGGRPTHCSKHRGAEYIEVRNKQCEDPGCDIQASFGYLNGKKRLCASHKLKDMVYLRKSTLERKKRTETYSLSYKCGWKSVARGGSVS